MRLKGVLVWPKKPKAGQHRPWRFKWGMVFLLLFVHCDPPPPPSSENADKFYTLNAVNSRSNYEKPILSYIVLYFVFCFLSVWTAQLVHQQTLYIWAELVCRPRFPLRRLLEHTSWKRPWGNHAVIKFCSWMLCIRNPVNLSNYVRATRGLLTLLLEVRSLKLQVAQIFHVFWGLTCLKSTPDCRKWLIFKQSGSLTGYTPSPSNTRC